MSMCSLDSPYVVGPAIGDPSCFYGRQEQVERFFGAVKSSTLQSRRVLGARCSGKTSFLRYVSHPKVREAALRDFTLPVLIAYVDLESGVETPSDFFGGIAESIVSSGRPDACWPDLCTEPDFRAFKRWWRSVQIADPGLRLVVLLDEVEVLTEALGFERHFFRNLRWLATQGIMWVTASYRALYQICPHDYVSPFCNVFHCTPITMGPLRESEAASLISEPARTLGVHYTPREVDAIQEIAGPMPYLLQAAADKWFSNRSPRTPVDECKATVLEQLLDPTQGVPRQLSHHWSNLTDEEQQYLLRLTSVDSLPATKGYMQRQLLDLGFLLEKEGKVSFASVLFRQWVLNRKGKEVTLPDITPFMPVIIEATKFALGEARRLLDRRREKPEENPAPELAIPNLPVTPEHFDEVSADIRALRALIDVRSAQSLHIEIEGLYIQIDLHKRKILGLETELITAGAGERPALNLLIDRERKAMTPKIERLLELLNAVYRNPDSG